MAERPALRTDQRRAAQALGDDFAIDWWTVDGGAYERSATIGRLDAGATEEWYCETNTQAGAARPGSSGSPAFDSAHRVRGTRSCAGPNKYTSCPPDEWLAYGAYDAAFPIVCWYLWEMASPTYVDGGVPGDPGNSGDSERGSAANPFNTVYEGTFCVPSGGDVDIAWGNYNEQFHLWRPMTLRRDGTSGVVRIGQP